LYSCQYGTFLFNSEKERVDVHAKERTRSVWDYFLSRREQFLNPKYDPLIDDNKRGKERLIFPRLSEVRWWHEAFGRTDAEMNGPRHGPSRDSSTGRRTPVLTGVETTRQAIGSGLPGKTVPAAAATGMAALTAGLSNLGLPKNKENSQGSKSSSNGTSEMEVEMQ
jgi:hypothetical protein